MKHKKTRYVQPTGVEDAMRIIQKLFNSYRNAPLTNELLTYHNNLIQRLRSDIYQEAQGEENHPHIHQLDNMIKIMENWSRIRLANQPFNAKMRHFKLISDNSAKFKRRTHRISQSSNHRGVRH
ncbi:hypothetical protein AALA17_05340 [Lactobacillaceae bacterium 24-114]